MATMTEEHKEALARGRVEGKAVAAYLEGLRDTKPRRGRKRTAESVQKRIDAIDTDIGSASPIDQLLLVQERRDLQDELEAFSVSVDLEALADDFIEHAAAYSERKGISYATWRDVGVPAAVLKSAKVARTA